MVLAAADQGCTGQVSVGAFRSALQAYVAMAGETITEAELQEFFEEELAKAKAGAAYDEATGSIAYLEYLRLG